MTRPDQAQDDALPAVAAELVPLLWMPPGLRFEVGDRVQIRLSGECRQEWGQDFIPGHPVVVDGAVGTIIKDPYGDPAPWSDTHPYVVMFDQPQYAPIRVGGKQGLWNGGYFAACELQPATDSGEQGRGREG